MYANIQTIDFVQLHLADRLNPSWIIETKDSIHPLSFVLIVSLLSTISKYTVDSYACLAPCFGKDDMEIAS